MQINELIQKLTELNDTPMAELEEKLSGMSMTYGDWSQIMDRKNWYSTLHERDTKVEILDALSDKYDISFDFYKELFTKYGRDAFDVYPSQKPNDVKARKLSETLKNRLEPFKRLSERFAGYQMFVEELEYAENEEDKQHYEERIQEQIGKMRECLIFSEEKYCLTNEQSEDRKKAVEELLDAYNSGNSELIISKQKEYRSIAQQTQDRRFTTQEIGKATINQPTTEKQETARVENENMLDNDKINEGESIDGN